MDMLIRAGKLCLQLKQGLFAFGIIWGEKTEVGSMLLYNLEKERARERERI